VTGIGQEGAAIQPITTRRADPRTSTLRSPAWPAGPLRQAVDKRLWKQLRARRKALSESGPVGRAVKPTIEAEDSAAAAVAGEVALAT
jgi:hypothetical protein